AWTYRDRQLRGHPCLVPAALVVWIFVDLAAPAIEFDRAPLLAHVDLEFAARAPAFPAIVLVAQPVPAFAQRKRHPAPRRHPDVDQSGERAAELGEGIHLALPEQH